MCTFQRFDDIQLSSPELTDAAATAGEAASQSHPAAKS